MTFRLDMDVETRTLVSHMAPERKQLVREALRTIAGDPFHGKPLREELSGLYSHRVGPLRIVYEVDRPAKAVHVVAIGPRRTIYEELEKNLARRERGS